MRQDFGQDGKKSSVLTSVRLFYEPCQIQFREFFQIVTFVSEVLWLQNDNSVVYDQVMIVN